ncbi:hypothetical protein V6U71_21650 [Sphingopyxis sp. J-6]|uniref:hypothetical protein n=1 Tax=Sphingopyxis sp. J-6 TaxID=3122054 RepID=UPI0039845D60
MSRAERICARAEARVEEICRAFPPINPPPQYWLMSDAGPDYCRECVIIARGKEFELGPLITESEYRFCRSDWEDAYFEGIDGGRDIEGESASHCSRCGKTLSYILTDYGAESEALYWLECPADYMNDETSYGLDRLALNLYHGMERKRLLMICAVVGQTYRLFKAPEERAQLCSPTSPTLTEKETTPC